MTDAVLFDYFNTCTTAVRRGGGHRRTAEALGVDPDAWLALLDRTFDERARGAYGSHLGGLRRLCGELGVEPTTAQLRTAVELRLAALQDDAPLRAETIPVLRALRAAGVRLAIVSDCWFELPLFLPRLPIGPLLDAKTFSVEVGATKPSPAMYADACAKLGVEPEECVYVGDGGGMELTGAQLFGMTAIRLAAPDLGDHLSFAPDTDWIGPTITSLAELPHLLARAPALVNT